MKKQTFRAKSMTEAVEVVKRALGPEAVIISVRPVPSGPAWKVWQSPGVEVIAVGGGKGETISPEAAAMMASQLEAEAALKEEDLGAAKHLGTPDKKAVNRQAFQAALRRTGAGKTAADTQVVSANGASVSEDEKDDSEPPSDRGEASFTGTRPEPDEINFEAEETAAFQTGIPEISRISPEAHEAAIQTAKLITEMVSGDPKRVAQLSAFLKKKTAERSGNSTDPGQTPAARQVSLAEENAPPSQISEMRSETREVRKKPLEKVDIPLTLNTPKPKLAFDELTAALQASVKGEAGKENQSEKPAERSFQSSSEKIPQYHVRRKNPPSIHLPMAEDAAITDFTSDKDEDERRTSGLSQKPKTRPIRTNRIETPIEVISGAFIPSALPPHLAIAYDTLSRQGVDTTLLEKTIQACAEALSPQTLAMPDTVQEYIMRILEGNLRTLTPAQLRTHRLICVVGSSGAGKTSLTAKLAAHAVKEKGGQVIWISADTVRTGAIAEARVFGDLLGVRQYLVYTPEDLEGIVSEMNSHPESTPSTILVDTPACNPYNEASLVEMGAFLNALPGRVTYLTVPATAKETDLTQIQAAYGIFKIDGLVITKLDETRTIGSVFNLAWRSQIPLAYFTTGSRLLEDLHPADRKIFSGALFRTG